MIEVQVFIFFCLLLNVLGLQSCKYNLNICTRLESISWIAHDGFESPVTIPNSIKVLTYNILGPLHGESSKHDYAPVSVTKWTRRRDKLLDEIRSNEPDIICLQEVSHKSLRESFIPGLKRIGLTGCVFAPSKTNHRSQTRFGHDEIGCAIFANESKFRILLTGKYHLR